MVSLPSPLSPDPLDAELDTLYARRAAVNRLIAELERYACLKGDVRKRPISVLPLGRRKAV